MRKASKYKFPEGFRTLQGFMKEAGWDSERLNNTITRSKYVVGVITEKA